MIVLYTGRARRIDS